MHASALLYPAALLILPLCMSSQSTYGALLFCVPRAPSTMDHAMHPPLAFSFGRACLAPTLPALCGVPILASSLGSYQGKMRGIISHDWRRFCSSGTVLPNS